MISFNQPALVGIGMIQHATLCGVLYVEKIVHEIDRTGDRISTLTEFIDLLLRVDLLSVRCLDQHSLCGLGHGY